MIDFILALLGKLIRVGDDDLLLVPGNVDVYFYRRLVDFGINVALTDCKDQYFTVIRRVKNKFDVQPTVVDLEEVELLND